MVEAMNRFGPTSVEFRDVCIKAAAEFQQLGLKREAAAAYLSAGHVAQHRSDAAAAIQLFRQAVHQDWRWLTAWSVVARHEAQYAEHMRRLGKVDAALHYRRAWRSYRIAARLARRSPGKDAANYDVAADKMALELRLLALASPKRTR